MRSTHVAGLIKPMLAFSILALIGSEAVAAPFIPTIKLRPESILTVELDIATTGSHALVPGSVPVATVSLGDGQHYTVVVSVTEPIAGDEALPRVTLADGEVAELSFSMRLQSPAAPAPRFAKEAKVACAVPGADPTASFAGTELADAACATQNRSVHIIGGGDIGYACLASGTISVDLVPSQPTDTTTATAGELAATPDDPESSPEFGWMTLNHAVSVVQVEEGETWNAPITPTVKLVQGTEDPELSPLVPTIRVTDGQGTAFLGSLWGTTH